MRIEAPSDWQHRADSLAPAAPVAVEQWAGLFAGVIEDRDGFEFAVRVVGGLANPSVRVVLRHAGHDQSRDVSVDELSDAVCELVAAISTTKARRGPIPTLTTPSLEALPSKPSIIAQVVGVMRELPKQTARARDIAQILGLDWRLINQVLWTYSRRGKYVRQVTQSRPGVRAKQGQTIYRLIEEMKGRKAA